MAQFLRFQLDLSPLDSTSYGLDGDFAFTEEGVATASSALTATANANVLPPSPASSTDSLTGSVQFVQPNNFILKKEVQKPVNVVTANALSFNVFNANATSVIEFSILEEDNELLLLM
jgi:hypothetical protein